MDIEGGPPIRKGLNCAGGCAFPEKTGGTSQAAGAVGPGDVRPTEYTRPCFSAANSAYKARTLHFFIKGGYGRAGRNIPLALVPMVRLINLHHLHHGSKVLLKDREECLAMISATKNDNFCARSTFGSSL